MERFDLMEILMTQAIVEHAGPTPRGQRPAFTQGILENVLRILARRRTERELARLDDHLLADIGLSRGDIYNVAAQATSAPSQKKHLLGLSGFRGYSSPRRARG